LGKMSFGVLRIDKTPKIIMAIAATMKV